MAAASIQVEIGKANAFVTTPTVGTVTYDPGKKLSDIELTGGWRWVNGNTVPTVGNSGYEAVLTVDDANYKYTGIDGYNVDEHTVTRIITFPVNKAAGTISYATTTVAGNSDDAAFTNPLTQTGDGSVTYASDNTSVATVDSAGKVTIKGAGTAKITATVTDSDTYTYATKTASYTLTVSAKACTVSFNANGHGTAPATQTVAENATATKPTDPSATGYTFGGWYKEAACTNTYDFSTKVTADITLYAKWTAAETEAQTEKQTEKTYTSTPCTVIRSAKRTNKKVKITWKDVTGAEGYDVLVAYTTDEFKQKNTITTSSTNAVITKINGKSLDNKKHIRYHVIAYKTVNGKKTYISQARSGFLTAPKSPGRTDSKSLTVSKSEISVNTGDTVKIKAKQKKVNKGKAFLKGGRNVRFVSSCKKIAAVNENGVVTGVNAGTCKVYAIAANGVTKVISVTVE